MTQNAYGWTVIVALMWIGSLFLVYNIGWYRGCSTGIRETTEIWSGRPLNSKTIHSPVGANQEVLDQLSGGPGAGRA